MTPSPPVDHAFAAPLALVPPSRLEPEPADPAALADEAAWADVVAAWDDEERHRAYLARCVDLESLANAGRRYRGVLADRPGDAVAARFRDEVLRRAVAAGLAALPRAAPEHRRAKLAIRAAAIAVVAGLLVAAAVMASRVVPFLAGGARP